MLNSQLAAAFDGLVEAVAGRKERREAAQQVVRRMLNLGLIAAFDAFVEGTTQLRAHRDTVSRAVVRWRSPLMEQCFRGWE
eukprot:3110158-Rhodomonas_salina.1